MMSFIEYLIAWLLAVAVIMFALVIVLWIKDSIER